MEKGLDEEASQEESPDLEEMDETDRLRLELADLKEQMEEEKERSQKFLDQAKRIQADFDNYKKRQQQEMKAVTERANDDLIKEILTIVDDFERAIDAKDSAEFQRGVEQMYSNLLSLIKEYDLREIPVEGKFDPSLHEALSVGKGEGGRILEVYQKGYFRGDRVLRYSKVKVGKNMEEDD